MRKPVVGVMAAAALVTATLLMPTAAQAIDKDSGTTSCPNRVGATRAYRDGSGWEAQRLLCDVTPTPTTDVLRPAHSKTDGETMCLDTGTRDLLLESIPVRGQPLPFGRIR